jgi:polyphosphate kinase
MPTRYFNRERSWLEFNARVLDEALDPKTPLLERLRFLAIFTSNLDEFFMVRVAGLLKMREEGLVASDSPEEIDSSALIGTLRIRTTELLEAQYRCFEETLTELQKHDVKISKISELTKDERKFVAQYFRDSIFPVLTPLAYDAAHPFPFLSNLSLYLIVQPDLQQTPDESLPKICFVEIPSILPRLIRLPGSERSFHYVCIDDMIAEHIDDLFLGIKVKNSGLVRVTRNLDYTLLENEVVDLLKSMTKEMVLRQQQEVVRLEYQRGMPVELVELIRGKIQVPSENIFQIPAPMHIPSFSVLCHLNLPELKFESFNPRLPARFELSDDIFELISQEDILVHHPYESFYAVTEFLKTAAQDPQVLAIKQMLYRTGGDSPVLQALIDAAAFGKHVTAVVELKARFDEKNNIGWARELERAGVNVVFGFVDLKTHSKATLVVRREGNELKRYAHLSTGNYNSVTARLYTDVGLFTKDVRLCEDVSQLFNLVTGVNVIRFGRVAGLPSGSPQFNDMAIAPMNLRQRILQLIDREIQVASQGRPARMIAKMNALVDKELIDKLYEASAAGVKIQLIIRGICCLRPNDPVLSQNIEVISIIDRFLEHSRIYYFAAGGLDEVYLSSADWMPRNMDRRVEAFFPIKNSNIKRRLVDEILTICLADNVKARVLQHDGRYVLRVPGVGAEALRSQAKFIEIARAAGLKSIPYDKAMSHDPVRSKSRRPVQKRDKKPKKIR